jgi:catechol 2,3-dioxygenase-like lactoylglutathione lyase family enzyme
MDPRVSFVTLAVADLDRTRAFYVDGLGWEPELFVPGDVLMIRTGDKLVLSLWSEAGFESEVGPIRRGEGLAPITLAHNVATEAEVDEILALAASLGAEASKAERRDWVATPATSPTRTASAGRSPSTPARSVSSSFPEVARPLPQAGRTSAGARSPG